MQSIIVRGGRGGRGGNIGCGTSVARCCPLPPHRQAFMAPIPKAGQTAIWVCLGLAFGLPLLYAYCFYVLCKGRKAREEEGRRGMTQ